MNFAFVSQRFSRQQTEDGRVPSAKWGADLLIADTEDPDDEDNMPIPDVGSVPASGKTRSSIQDWSEDEDNSDILEVYGPCPVAFSYPVSSPSADPDDQVIEVEPLAVGGAQGPYRKRAATGSSKAGSFGVTVPPSKKQKKKVVKKPRTGPVVVP